MNEKQRVHLISLGCAKNLVDSENILGLLQERDCSIVPEVEDANVAIINTCAFVQEAVEESVETILDVAHRKKDGCLKRLLVVGCLVQRFGYRLRKEIPEVDGWLGTGEISRIGELLKEGDPGCPSCYIGRPLYLADHTVPRVQTTPFYTAYLKIAEGCSHKCTFCTIPSLRGPFRSRDLESLIIEAEEMAERGVKEVNLIGQDTTMYGRDLHERTGLEDLLERLVLIPGIRWVRILYAHPIGISERLLDILDREGVLCPYLDLPFQHVNEGILRAMGRPLDGANPWRLVERIRSRIPRLSLRTTLMVGFPGETEEIFHELCHFVEVSEFDHMGAFIFSPERGTPAARYDGMVDRRVGEERLDELMGLQARISRKKNQQMLEKIVPVLIEGVSEETDFLLRGRTATMAPHVDTQVLINKGKGSVGEIVPVRIKEAHTYDLVGEIVAAQSVEEEGEMIV